MLDKNEKEILDKLDKILASLKVSTVSKYMTAKEVEREYGISTKTLLNRSNLPVTHKRYIPSVCLKGGRKKHFERKVLDRLFGVSEANR